IRFVTDTACNLIVDHVQLSASGADTFDNTIAELAAQGYDDPTRKYLVWMDANELCGIATFYPDDEKTDANYNNGGAPGSVERIDSGCWGLASQGQSIEAHELMHSLGAVMPTAPHGSPAGHCSDSSDRMCYLDGTVLTLLNVCGPAHEATFDCNNDDYFNTAPGPGNYLYTHWNAADNSFITAASAGAAPTPRPGVLVRGRRRRHLRLRRLAVLRVDGLEAVEPADRRDGRHPVRPRLLARGSRRRDLRLRRRPVLRVHRRHPAQPADRRDGGDAIGARLLVRGRRRRDLRLRRRPVLRVHRRETAQPADRGDGRHAVGQRLLARRRGRRRLPVRRRGVVRGPRPPPPADHRLRRHQGRPGVLAGRAGRVRLRLRRRSGAGIDPDAEPAHRVDGGDALRSGLLALRPGWRHLRLR